jgi:hypothetical protein
MIVAMPRDGAIIFSDLIGKLDIYASVAPRAGGMVAMDCPASIDSRGRDAKLIDWIDELTAECPKKIAHNMNDPCGARCPDLPRVS